MVVMAEGAAKVVQINSTQIKGKLLTGGVNACMIPTLRSKCT